MNQPFRLEKKDSFRVCGYALNTTNKKHVARTAIPKFWEEFNRDQLASSLMPLNNQNPLGLFGISVYNHSDDPKAFIYYIAVSTDQKSSGELKEYTIPANTWAIFPCTIETIGNTEAMAIMKWLPKSNYRPLNKGYITGNMKSLAPDIQYYGKDGLVEVWVAVEEK